MLSDRDQQLLIGIERGLAAQDPALAARLGPQPDPTPMTRRHSRWVVVGAGVLTGLVAPVVVLVTMPTLPAVLIVIVLALVGRVVGMCAVDDRGHR